MRLYKTISGIILEHDRNYRLIHRQWDHLINRDNLYSYLDAIFSGAPEITAAEAENRMAAGLMAPVGRQEVWAAGVTYLRSRDARMEEAQGSGGADLYDRVYDAVRPELFFKSMPHKVAGPGQDVHIRHDSEWSVPEPELTLFINSAGDIQAYTVGNDMSSRSIEGDNPLYLPQAKIYDRSAALGPALLVTRRPVTADLVIEMTIKRKDVAVYHDTASIGRMKRRLTELVDFLYRESDFDDGCFLMTGTCLVPPDTFTLQEKDIVEITIGPIGTLVNAVSYKPARV